MKNYLDKPLPDYIAERLAEQRRQEMGRIVSSQFDEYIKTTSIDVPVTKPVECWVQDDATSVDTTPPPRVRLEIKMSRQTMKDLTPEQLEAVKKQLADLARDVNLRVNLDVAFDKLKTDPPKTEEDRDFDEAWDAEVSDEDIVLAALVPSSAKAEE